MISNDITACNFYSFFKLSNIVFDLESMDSMIEIFEYIFAYLV